MKESPDGAVAFLTPPPTIGDSGVPETDTPLADVTLSAVSDSCSMDTRAAADRERTGNQDHQPVTSMLETTDTG